MPVEVERCNSFERNIQNAVKALKEKDYTTAQEHIKCAMLENWHSSQVHNLIGILAEFTGDLSLAGKHFRAAYALEPTYKPASRNLERIGSFIYRAGNTKPDYGDKPEKENSSPYIIEYDKNKIGHLAKKGVSEMKKNNYNYIVIAGCSRFGANIASMLSARGKDVVVLDNNSFSFRKLSTDYSGFTIDADATDIDELVKAGIERANVVVAATNDDNTNIMIAQIASKIFNVPKVISRLYDTEKEIVYQDSKIQLIYPSRLSISEFEKIISQDDAEV